MDHRDVADPVDVGGRRVLTPVLWAALAGAGPVWVSLAGAGPVVEVHAVVSDDLRWITGTMRVTDGDALDIVAPLDRLPHEVDDRNWLRTFPGRRDRGEQSVEPIGGVWAFETRLPRRYGDVGSTWRGLFANGWWHPVLVDPGGGLVSATWRVDLDVPDGVGVAVGFDRGVGGVQTEFVGERVSLAAVRHPTMQPVGPDGVALLSRGRPRRGLVAELDRVLLAMGRPVGWNGTIVESPLRRRLARSGVGVAYVSDRAFRVVRPLRRYHRVAVARGVLTSLLDVTDPFARDVTGATLASVFAEDLRGPPARRVLGALRFLPTVDYVLNDGTLPFHADVLEAAFPGDPLADDLVEAIDPHVPGPAVVAQLADAWGSDAVRVLGRSLFAGRSLLEAASDAGIPPDAVTAYDAPYTTGDWSLVVGDDVVVTRVATDEAPPEVLVVRVDGERHVARFGVGAGSWAYDGEEPVERVVVDPERHTLPASRLGDSWPSRFVTTASGAIETLNLSEGWIAARLSAAMRRSGSNRGSAGLSVGTSRDTVASATLSYTWRFGREHTGLSRAHRVALSLSGGWLAERFAAPEDAPGTVGLGIAWQWSSTPPALFPLRGWRLAARIGGGSAVGADQRWASGVASATAHASPHPRLVFAARGAVGWAASDLQGRLLSLGGPGVLRSLPYGSVLGTTRAVALSEIRVVPIRDASVPLLVLWGSELQLTGGFEVGTAGTPEGAVHAAGWTAGAAVVGEVLGADPYLLGITVGAPLWVSGTEADGFGVYLRWGQEF